MARTPTDPARYNALQNLYPTFEAWQDAGFAFGKRRDKSLWDIGDWILYGESCWPKKATRYWKARQATGYSQKALYELFSVANRVHPSVRTEMLSWNHHRQVAKLDHEEQKQWLASAIAKKWSVAQLRKEIQSATGSTPTAAEMRERKVSVQFCESEYRVVQQLAKAHGWCEAEFIRQVLAAWFKENAGEYGFGHSPAGSTDTKSLRLS